MRQLIGTAQPKPVSSTTAHQPIIPCPHGGRQALARGGKAELTGATSSVIRLGAGLTAAVGTVAEKAMPSAMATTELTEPHAGAERDQDTIVMDIDRCDTPADNITSSLRVQPVAAACKCALTSRMVRRGAS